MSALSPSLKTPESSAREAFVERVKQENFYRDSWCRVSLKQHWGGPENGFADERLQARWLDFKAGFLAGANEL